MIFQFFIFKSIFYQRNVLTKAHHLSLQNLNIEALRQALRKLLYN